MILRATQDVQRTIKLKAGDEFSAPVPSRFLEEWYVNRIVVDRRHYFLFVEALTIYSVIVPLKGITTRQSFEHVATNVLFARFKRNADLDIGIFEALAERVVVLKTADRRILGSMNEQAFIAQARPEGAFDSINDNILSYLKYDSPRDAFDKAASAAVVSDYQSL